MESDEQSLVLLVQGVASQLDNLIRGRKVDLGALHAVSCSLLARSFGEEDVGERGQLVSSGTKLHNMLRSPRFSQHEGSQTFSLIRAAAANLVSLKDENSLSSVVSLRCRSRSAQELGRLPGHIDGALRIIGILERRWASLDGLAIAALPAAELKECQDSVLSSLLLKCDLLSATGVPAEAIECLRSVGQQNRLVQGLPNATVALATKAFRYGQHVLVQRESTVEGSEVGQEAIDKGASAGICYEAALEFLRGSPVNQTTNTPQDQQIASDSRDLQAKCLTQLALARHLEGRHDDALVCLDGVSGDSPLRETSQELRFGILLAARRVDEAHRCVHSLLRQATAGCEAFRPHPMRLGEAPDCARLLKWLRRLGVATHFDSSTLQHYSELQTKWQDDERNLEVRLQLIAGLLLEGQCPSPPPSDSSGGGTEATHQSPTPSSSLRSSISPLTAQGLRFCDDILNDHRARQRLLSPLHFSRIETFLTAALNAAHQRQQIHVSKTTVARDNSTSMAVCPEGVIAISERLVRCLELLDSPQLTGATASSGILGSGGNDGHKASIKMVARLGTVLAIQAEALFALDRVSEASATASRAIDVCLSFSSSHSPPQRHVGQVAQEGSALAGAFAIKFRCIILTTNPVSEGLAALEEIEAKISALLETTHEHSQDAIHSAGWAHLNALYQTAAILSGISPLERLANLTSNVSSQQDEGSGGKTKISESGESGRVPNSSALTILELAVSNAFVRAFQRISKLSKSSLNSEHKAILPATCPSFAAFLLRVILILCEDPGRLFCLQPNKQTAAVSPVSSVLPTAIQLLESVDFLVEKLNTSALPNVGAEGGSANECGDRMPIPVAPLLGSSKEVEAVGSACWNLAVTIRQKSDVSAAQITHLSAQGGSTTTHGFSTTTKLFIAAFELQKNAECCHNSENHDLVGQRRERDESRSDDECEGTAHKNKKCKIPSVNLTNRVGMLTMAASDVVDRLLVRPSEPTTSQETPPSLVALHHTRERKKEHTQQLWTALGWMQQAQDYAHQAIHLFEDAGSNGGTLQALQGMLVTLSMLRLMSGLHGFLSAPSSSSDSVPSSPATPTGETFTESGKIESAEHVDHGREEALLLRLVSECKSELELVPPETLRAAACSAKSRSHFSTAHALLSIAIDHQSSLLLEQQGSNPVGALDNLDEVGTIQRRLFEARQTLASLYCDMFHVSPSVDACLKVADDLLELLDGALKSKEPQVIDVGGVEGVASQCYNWGLQGLSLGSVGAGASSERLIGKAQQLLRHCPSLRHHENDIIQAYQRALEVKEEEHEALVHHTRMMDSS